MAVGQLPVRVFVISLESAIERRQHMTDVLSKIGITAEFFPAVDGRRLTTEQRNRYSSSLARRIYGCDMNDSEIGCYLSHDAIYEKMIRENIETALILEDDIDCVRDLKMVIDDLMAQDSWQLVRLMSSRGRVVAPRTSRDYGATLGKIGQRDLCRIDRGILGSCAYLIRMQAAEAMHQYGRSIFMPIDQTLDRFWENGIVPLVLRPMPVWHRNDLQSDIGERGRLAGPEPDWRELLQRRVQRLLDAINKRVFWLSYSQPTVGAPLSLLGWRSARLALSALAVTPLA